MGEYAEHNFFFMAFAGHDAATCDPIVFVGGNSSRVACPAAF